MGVESSSGGEEDLAAHPAREVISQEDEFSDLLELVAQLGIWKGADGRVSSELVPGVERVLGDGAAGAPDPRRVSQSEDGIDCGERLRPRRGESKRLIGWTCGGHHQWALCNCRPVGGYSGPPDLAPERLWRMG